ncbi:MAG: hypothetical protein HC824_18745 [Synechococcales cyanobacterium RM1_1_8]|nr:hypothetical protein [Synechococcales cyanobacterium RM1_1_8]
MAGAETKICPVCQVKIVPAPGGDRVEFSSGPAGTRAKLWARVCQFVDKPACINRDRGVIGNVTATDYYETKLPQMPGEASPPSEGS